MKLMYCEIFYDVWKHRRKSFNNYKGQLCQWVTLKGEQVTYFCIWTWGGLIWWYCTFKDWEKRLLISFVKLQMLSHTDPAKFFMHRTLSICGGLRCLLTVPRLCDSHLIVYTLDSSSFYLSECHQPLFSLLTVKYIFPFIYSWHRVILHNMY